MQNTFQQGQNFNPNQQTPVQFMPMQPNGQSVPPHAMRMQPPQGIMQIRPQMPPPGFVPTQMVGPPGIRPSLPPLGSYSGPMHASHNSHNQQNQNVSNNTPHKLYVVSHTALVAQPVVKSQKSVASDLLMSTRIPVEIQQQLKKTIFVSKISRQASNQLLERLLKVCGPLLNWKRSITDPSKPQSFGLAEFDALESVYVCLKVIHNLRVFDNNILVKADQKTKEYLDSWAAAKEEEWIARHQKDGTYDPAMIAVIKARGEILPYERLLIPQYDQICKEIDEALENSGSILNKELNFIGGAESTIKGGPTAESNEAAETLLKFKANERELERERRSALLEKEREAKFQKKQEEWLEREEQRIAAKERAIDRTFVRSQEVKELTEQLQHIEELIKTFPNHKKIIFLIEKDLAFNSVEEKKKKKRDPRTYQRMLDDRKVLRQNEREADRADLEREQQELAEAERLQKLEEARLEEKRQREEELRERLKIKRFIEMQEEIERQKQIEDDKKALELILQQQAQQRQQKASEAPINHLSSNKESTDSKLQVKKEIAQEESQTQKGDPERERQIFEKTKEIYLGMPKNKTQVLASVLDFKAMATLNLFEKVVRTWVAQKIKALLGIEEQAMITLVLGHLKTCSATPDSMMAKVGGILDEDSEEFVFKLWHVLLFEHLKIQGGIYDQPAIR